MQRVSPLVAPQEGNKRDHDPVVLVVDDQPVIRDMLSWWLSLQGYHPTCTANGREALQWMEKTHSTELYPRVILLDLYMPVMDGRQFLAALRAQRTLPLPPVILLTVERNNNEHLACNNVLMKPFHLKELRECLEHATQKSGLPNLERQEHHSPIQVV